MSAELSILLIFKEVETVEDIEYLWFAHLYS